MRYLEDGDPVNLRDIEYRYQAESNMWLTDVLTFDEDDEITFDGNKVLFDADEKPYVEEDEEDDE